MAKEYIRKCDGCGKIINNLYNYGVTTLYKNIRIGRGKMFHDYDEESINNLMSKKIPNDYDSYGRTYQRDENMEFSFCSPECTLNFLLKLYKDTFEGSINLIKKEKEEKLDISIKEFKIEYGEKISFFQKIQTMFSKKYFKEDALKLADKLIKDIQKEKKKLN